MRLVLLIGNKPRHLYFAKRIKDLFNVVGMIIEEHAEFPVKSELVRKHFKDFAEVERDFFGNPPLPRVLKIEPKTINYYSDGIRRLEPDVIVVYSTSLIGQEIIDICPGRIINLHAGLSPYYRGSGTNIMPFYNNELEYVGMTVHRVTKIIDGGDIISRERPIWRPNDNTHTIGCACVEVGIQLMIEVLESHLEYSDGKGGFCAMGKQDLSKGKLYPKNAFTDKVLKKIYKNIEDGIVRDYCENPQEVDIRNC